MASEQDADSEGSRAPSRIWPTRTRSYHSQSSPVIVVSVSVLTRIQVRYMMWDQRSGRETVWASSLVRSGVGKIVLDGLLQSWLQ